MEKIELVNFVNEESDLQQFDARNVLARLMNVPAENLFPLPEGQRIRMAILAQTLESPLDLRVNAAGDNL